MLTNEIIAGMAPPATVYRHPPFIFSKPAPTPVAISWPIVRNTTLSVTRRPRKCAGASSPIHKGTIIEATPTPIPTTKRPPIRVHVPWAAAWIIAPTMKTTFASAMTIFRPIHSDGNIAHNEPINAPREVADVISCFVPSPN